MIELTDSTVNQPIDQSSFLRNKTSVKNKKKIRERKFKLGIDVTNNQLGDSN